MLLWFFAIVMLLEENAVVIGCIRWYYPMSPSGQRKLTAEEARSPEANHGCWKVDPNGRDALQWRQDDAPLSRKRVLRKRAADWLQRVSETFQNRWGLFLYGTVKLRSTMSDKDGIVVEKRLYQNAPRVHVISAALSQQFCCSPYDPYDMYAALIGERPFFLPPCQIRCCGVARNEMNTEVLPINREMYTTMLETDLRASIEAPRVPVDMIDHLASLVKRRQRAVHKMNEIVERYKLSAETFFSGVAVLDRCIASLFAQRTPPAKQSMKLLAMTSLLISSKYHDLRHPSLAMMACACSKRDRHVNKEDIARTEIDVLRRIGYKLSIPTAHDFLEYYLAMLPEQFSHVITRVRETARRRIKTFSESTQMACLGEKSVYAASTLAMASLYVSIADEFAALRKKAAASSSQDNKKRKRQKEEKTHDDTGMMIMEKGELLHAMLSYYYAGECFTDFLHPQKIESCAASLRHLACVTISSNPLHDCRSGC